MALTVASYAEENLVDGLVKTFLDIIVLATLNGNSVHGYKIIADLHRTFGVLLSPGTLYPLLYSLEKEKLVEVIEAKRKKLYRLTPKGRKRVVALNNMYKENSGRIFRFVDLHLSESV